MSNPPLFVCDNCGAAILNINICPSACDRPPTFVPDRCQRCHGTIVGMERRKTFGTYVIGGEEYSLWKYYVAGVDNTVYEESGVS